MLSCCAGLFDKEEAEATEVQEEQAVAVAAKEWEEKKKQEQQKSMLASSIVCASQRVLRAKQKLYKPQWQKEFKDLVQFEYNIRLY